MVGIFAQMQTACRDDGHPYSAIPIGKRMQYPTTSSTAAVLAWPAARVRYPATSTATAAARMNRLRRVSRNRRGRAVLPPELEAVRELGIS